MANVYDNIINGTFNSLGREVPFVPSPSVSEMYAGIIPSTSPTYQPGMRGRGITPIGSPNLTAAEQQLLQQQLQQSQALQAGYNPDGTPKPTPAIPSVGTPAPATWNKMEQANYDARNKRGTWLDQSRMQAQALMRQMAALQGGMPMAPGAAPATVPARGGLAALITGSGTPREKQTGIAGLIGGANTGRTYNVGQRYEGTNGYIYEAQPNGQFYNQGYSTRAEEERKAQGKAIGEANRKNPGTTRNVFGDNNAFQPRSVQNSVRFQTGY